MNTDIRVLIAEGERAVRADDAAAARRAFLEAGRCAARGQLWRSAVRCYRRVLELDLVDREPIARVLELPARAIGPSDWSEYGRALDRHRWPAFGCRAAQTVTGDLGATIECPGAGVVLELIMTEDDLVETRPALRFTGMPLAMAMIILRRGLWLAPRDQTADPGALRVAFDGRPQVRLDEIGDWTVIPSASPHGK